MKLQKVGIRFTDNDFYNTMMPFMGLLLDLGGDECPSKAKIVELFNMLAPGLYWMFQNKFQYSNTLDHREHMKKYLQIKEENVFFDNEVTQHINKVNGWDNSEFHYVDFYLKDIFTI